MAKRKKDVQKVGPLTEGKKNIISALIEEYDIETADDIQAALRDLLGGTIKSMMEAEMDEHLGYSSYERSDSDNYRNGTKSKRIRSNYGEFEIDAVCTRVDLQPDRFLIRLKKSMVLNAVKVLFRM